MRYEIMWTENVYYRAVVEADNATDAEMMLWDGDVDIVELDRDVVDASIRVKEVRNAADCV